MAKKEDVRSAAIKRARSLPKAQSTTRFSRAGKGSDAVLLHAYDRSDVHGRLVEGGGRSRSQMKARNHALEMAGLKVSLGAADDPALAKQTINIPRDSTLLGLMEEINSANESSRYPQKLTRDKLLKMNPQIKDPDKIQAGQQLVIDPGVERLFGKRKK
jgi:hypothetical protein